MRRQLAVVWMLTACVTVGRPAQRAEIDAIRPGVSTRADVEAILGPPTSVVVTGQGDTLLAWSYAHAGFAGANAGGRTVVVKFGPSGTVSEPPTMMFSGVDAEEAR